MDDFKTIIGLEVHAQLNTKAKMFCSCDNNSEGKKVNEVTCPICMGMPGTLPQPNKEAIKKTIKTGLALGSKINKTSKFDRKHYFYPDLPKGYQISQYDQPFCIGGELVVEDVKIRFNRVHLEEDAGKLLHPKGSKYSIVDLNRAGTPLMEMVTEPDIPNPHIAKVFLQELQQILRTLQVSSADMEKGHLRCDANINVIKGDKSSPIVELKNLNSFKFVEKALIYEEERLKNEFEAFSGKKTKQTRRFDATSGKTFAMREKEEAKDYRYFPEPDVPPIETDKFGLDKIESEQSELPGAVRSKLISWGISASDAAMISKNSKLLRFIEECASLDDKNSNLIAKILINQKRSAELSAQDLVFLAQKIKTGLPSNLVRQAIEQAADLKKPIQDFIKSESFNSDEIVAEVLRDNRDVVEKYKAGKTQVIGFLVGVAMRKGQGKLHPNEVREKLIKMMETR